MSRTDRHRPHWVQANDPFEQRKYWWPDGKFSRWILLYRDCCCDTYWCCGTMPNRHERRRSRHQAQRACREAVKDNLN